jgi:hypothetical protein
MSQRFWGKVSKQDDESCWEWTAALMNGYGWFHVNKTHGPKFAHRFSAFLNGLIDSIDSDMHVLHKCDNPKCCNPKHLFVGTNADNVADRVSKNRSGFKKLHGQSNGMSKLLDSDIRTIRGLYFSDQISQSKIAKLYGVKQPHISRIVNNVRCGGVS